MVVIKFTQRMQSTLMYEIHILIHNAETVCYVAIVGRKDLIFFSQSTQLKFSNLNS